MCPKKKIKQQDPLRPMLEVADKKILVRLIEDLAIMSPEVRRECFDYLKTHVNLSSDQKDTSDGKSVFALWWELEPDLAELDDYGGGDYGLVDHVGELLYQLQKKLSKNNVPSEYHIDLLSEVLPYIRSSNAGMDDELYGVAYSCCYDNADLRRLAGSFEKMNKDGPINHARRIYRKIGDDEKYLELRALEMEFGADYHDLATFYSEQGKKKKQSKLPKTVLKRERGGWMNYASFYRSGPRKPGTERNTCGCSMNRLLITLP